MNLKRICQTIVLATMAGPAGCATDVDDEWSQLGNWVEESPMPQRTLLAFKNRGLLIRQNSDGYIEEYEYHLEADTIYLTPKGSGRGHAIGLYFEQINNNTLKMGDLYPSIPENPRVYLIFSRD